MLTILIKANTLKIQDMKEEDYRNLKYLGLSKKETLVFWAFLNTKNISISKISAQTGIKRPTVYLTTERLVEKGFLKTKESQGKKIYSIINPEIIIDSNNKKLEAAKNFIPFLEKIYNKEDSEQNVIHYKGRNEIKKVHQKILESKKEILWYGEGYIREFPEFRNSLTNYAINNKNFPGSRSIDLNNNFNRSHAKLKNTYKKIKIQTRLLPADLFFSDSVVVIYDDKLLMISMGNEYFAILFDEKNVADLFRGIFELAWKSAEKP